MKIIDDGHHYHLEVYDRDGFGHEDLMFMKRIGDRYPGNEGRPHGGTNCQEVLRVLIDRMKYLNNQIPCIETEECINLARTMIYRFEQRAKKVKGKILSNVTIKGIEDQPTCKTCGHIMCDERH